MAFTDAELEKKLKDVGKQLSHPPDSVDELVAVLDQLEKLLLKVDQSPKKSMVEALKPSMNALIKDGFSKHSDMDVKVAVASCISEITRITAPDAPYSDEQMKDVFELIVSCFEDLADQYSRSYNKRAAILETVSKVRSCVIMLDLECDDLILKMFEHFLKSVRDYHHESVFSSMESIMVLVIEESEEVSAELLKPLLARVKKDREGVLPIAHKLGKGVLLKAADKIKPYLMPALTSLGESLDMYHKVVAAVCEGKTANFDDNDDNESGLQTANESKVEKESVGEAPQASESKLTTASPDHVEQVVKEDVCPEEEVDPTVENISPNPVMSNGVNEEVSVNQESKEPEEDIGREPLNKENTDDSDADKLAKEQPQTGKTSEQSEKETDVITNSVEPSDSSPVEGDKEVEKDNDVKESGIENEKDSDVKEAENEKASDVKEPENEKDGDVKDSETENEKDDDVKESETQNEKDNDVKESEDEAVIPLEAEKDKDTVEESSPKAVESKPAAAANVSSENSVPGESSVRSKQEPAPQEDETASPSKSVSPAHETREKKASLPKTKGLAQEVTPEAQKQAGKKTATAKEVKLVNPVNKSEDGDGEAGSDSDAKPLKKSAAKSKSTKQVGKKSKRSGKKLSVGGSDAKKPKQSGTKADVKGEESDSDAKPLKVSVKKGEKRKIDEEEEDGSDSKPLKIPAKKSALKKKDDGKEEEHDSDDQPLKPSAKKSTSKKKDDGKNKVAADEEEEDDSDNKLLKLSAKKSTSKKKDDGKKHGTGKNVAAKDQAKSQSGDDEMDISPKPATKSAKKEGSSTKTPVTSGKRKRSTVKTEVSDSVKYNESLVGTKVKVWWPEDEMFYEGVVAEFYPDKKKHKISYVDGDEETLNLRTQRWEILQEFSAPDNEEQKTAAQSEEASPETNKKKKSKTDPAKSQEKNKDSAKRAGGVTSSSKTKGSTPKDNKSNKKTSNKSSDTAATTAEKSKYDEETPKTSSKTKTVNKSKGKTTPSSSKSNTNGPTKGKSGSSNVKEPEDVKSTENTKGESKSGKKRKKST